MGEQDECRRAVLDRYGSVADYLAALRLFDIATPGSSHLREFYELYRRVFTLEEERETIDGFAKVLAFNSDRKVQAAFGPFREQITVAIDPITSRIVGAANFVVYAYDAPFAALGYRASAQLNFLCVEEAYRGLGIAGFLLSDMYRELGLFAPDCAGRLFITCEQNNPDRMTPEQLEQDRQAAQIDPEARRAWWRRQGYLRLMFDYCQPPLRSGQAPCRYIDLFIKTLPDGAGDIPAPLLIEHLRRFFTVSVGKFETDMATEPDWLLQKQALERLMSVPVDRAGVP